MWSDLLVGLCAGLLTATATAPVGVSGAVFLLPVQLTLLDVANPAVTPTNLLYNVVAGPGALLRYRAGGQLGGPLARTLLLGTIPGVVLGAMVRVFVLPGPDAFRVVAGATLVVIGAWLVKRTLVASTTRPLARRRVVALALGVGVVGGVYGIGGGPLLSPILVGSGMAVGVVAPAALASTFVTSVVGAFTFALLGLFHDGSVAPDWQVGLACGVGGLCGGYLGARLQPLVPERALRLLLGCLAVGIGTVFLAQTVLS